MEYNLSMEQIRNVSKQSYDINMNQPKQRAHENDIHAKSLFVTSILELDVTCGPIEHNPTLAI